MVDDLPFPSLRSAREPWSQFPHLDTDLIQNYEKSALQTRAMLRYFEGPVFESTLGLADFMPGATWCPMSIVLHEWVTDVPILKRDIPVVALASSSIQKGSHFIDPILHELDRQNVISCLRVSGIRPEEMPAGRLVLSRFSDRVRECAVKLTGSELPISEVTPATMEETSRGLLDNREQSQTIARSGLG